MLDGTDRTTAWQTPNRRQVGSLLLGTLAAGMTRAAAAQSHAEDVRIVDFDWVDGQRQPRFRYASTGPTRRRW